MLTRSSATKIRLVLAALGLCCYACAFSSGRMRVSRWLLLLLGARASIDAAHRLSSYDSWALGQRLSSCGLQASLLHVASSQTRDPTHVPCIGR